MEVPEKTAAEVWTAIQALDLDAIKIKLMDPKGKEKWSREQVDRVELAYKCYLFLTFKYPEQPLVPSLEIDAFWHHHILDTMKYAEDCQTLFGFFIHHFPYFGIRDREDAANLKKAGEETQRLFQQEFGDAGVKLDSYADCSSKCNTPPTIHSNVWSEVVRTHQRPTLN